MEVEIGELAGGGAKRAAVIDVDALLRRLEPRLRIERRPLELYSRTAEGNHPCTWLGGFETENELIATSRSKWPLKGSRGWASIREMVQAEADRARAHGLDPGRHLLKGITDNVWRLWSVGEIDVANLGGHPLTRHVDMSGEAVANATPNSPQGLVLAHLRHCRNGSVAAIELPSIGPPMHLPPELRMRHREHHLLVFRDRVKFRDENLGPWFDAIPRWFRS